MLCPNCIPSQTYKLIPTGWQDPHATLQCPVCKTYYKSDGKTKDKKPEPNLQPVKQLTGWDDDELAEEYWQGNYGI